MSDVAFTRALPLVTPENAHFWQGGAQGALMISHCGACGLWIHPTAPICRRCLSTDVKPEPVSGKAQVASFTINHQPWLPGLATPYVVAVVELVEQEGLRLMTNILNTPPGEVRIGMPVRVVFEQHDDVWLPLFEPDVSA
jgi:uncharacterized OB-fold protein